MLMAGPQAFWKSEVSLADGATFDSEPTNLGGVPTGHQFIKLIGNQLCAQANANLFIAELDYLQD